MLVDVHCHLSSDEFADDLDAVLDRAREAGVHRMICMGETPDDNERVLGLASRHAPLLAALGHYPAHLDEEAARRSEDLIRQHREALVAIGEVGIDHWIAREPAPREQQHRLFARFVQLALELDLPLSVHSRSAGHHAIDQLEALGAPRVCLHAFDGKAQHARRAASLGYYLSIPPSVARSPQKQKLVRAVPLDHLLLESDAPVLGPERDVRNEPANLSQVVQWIAELKEVPADEVREACARNTRALFGPLA